jgi:Xaa-Pro dipeptidase
VSNANLVPAVPGDELRRRTGALQAGLRDAGLAAALLVENTDLYYFTGTVQDSHLLVPTEASPILLVRRSLERARGESPLEDVRPLSSLRQLPAALESAGVAGERIGFEFDVLPVARLERYEELLAPADVVDCSAIVRRLRARKSTWEIDRISRAARMVDDAFRHAPELVRAGMTEIELLTALEQHLRRSGHDGVVRTRGFNQEIQYGVVLAGPDGCVSGGADAAVVGPGLNPAVGKGASRRPIAAGEPILVDLVGSVEGYLADETRTLAIGELEDVCRERYEQATTILAAVAAAAKPGISGGDLYALALELAGDAPGFMGAEPVSFVGHGLGLQIDEPPFLARGHTQPLEEGHVFALEPKFVLPGHGAVGIENTYVVEVTGARQLTAAPDLL